MNKSKICRELIKIANNLDIAGEHNSANELTKIAEKISVSNFFKDLASNYLNEQASDIVGRLDQQGNIPEYLKETPAFKKILEQRQQRETAQTKGLESQYQKQELLRKKKEIFDKANFAGGFALTNKPFTFLTKLDNFANITDMKTLFAQALNLQNNNRYDSKYSKLVQTLRPFYEQTIKLETPQAK